ncbi:MULTISPECIES: DUF418 domain-containing protein [unclassified Carboxylicivirga]|uniref:DUF418 domain-containing protein n=1 Tax=Carboxylicivirga TaxID=1628153 RepID=UPI003D338E07
MKKIRTRIEAVDALRGFAIFSILIIHCSNYFMDGLEIERQGTPFWEAVNSTTKSMLYFMFEGKAYGLFALLFGFTFGIQYYKAAGQKKRFTIRFLWRMLLLAGFGVLNAAFFAGGDPLIFMAMVAIILPLTARLSSKALLIIAAVLFLQPLEWFKIISLWLNPNTKLVWYTGGFYEAVRPAVANGEFIPMVWSNITVGLQACLAWAFEYGRISQTPGLYILGFLMYRHGLFNRTDASFWDRLCFFTLISTPLLFVVKAVPPTTSLIQAPLQVVFSMWYNLSFMLLMASLFIILYRSEGFRRLTVPLKWYGKMSLTNYIFQSIIATALFYPYGLNIAAYAGVAASVLIGLGIAALQIAFSYLWLNRYKQGPFEFIWHKATYLQVTVPVLNR